jgi:hypothetical protein
MHIYAVRVFAACLFALAGREPAVAHLDAVVVVAAHSFPTLGLLTSSTYVAHLAVILGHYSAAYLHVGNAAIRSQAAIGDCGSGAQATPIVMAGVARWAGHMRHNTAWCACAVQAGEAVVAGRAAARRGVQRAHTLTLTAHSCLRAV